ncbi:MAG TPA: pyridoxal phosphate-dependent aminotransferase [Acidimicrobiales bacterium]|nr:pyridoxal phosphate-dependent aminotransferase [Acidimicrobiales bacterium]
MVPRTPYLASRLQGYSTTIFAEMSALAAATGSVNLGQGFPDVDGPDEIKQWAVDAINAGHNQYPPGKGVAELRRAVSGHELRCYGLDYDAEDEILVTAGATEAIAAALLALCEVGDEVVMLEPFYDSYAACAAMAGASRRVVPLRLPGWRLDASDLDAAITARTRVVLVNSPHNPTGRVLTRDELELVARRCVEHDLIAVTDEVYEHLVYSGEHVPLATFPGMRDRTVTISSAGKTFALTGWKIGWACAPAPLLAAVRTAKQFLTYVSGAPFQHAIARALDAGDRLARVADALRDRRDQLADGLEKLGLDVVRPEGGYFVTTDVRSLGYLDGTEFCRTLPERCGVVAIPSAVFYDDPDAGRSLVRWAFCKSEQVIDDALGRLSSLAG